MAEAARPVGIAWSVEVAARLMGVVGGTPGSGPITLCRVLSTKETMDRTCETCQGESQTCRNQQAGLHLVLTCRMTPEHLSGDKNGDTYSDVCRCTSAIVIDRTRCILPARVSAMAALLVWPLEPFHSVLPEVAAVQWGQCSACNSCCISSNTKTAKEEYTNLLHTKQGLQ